MATDQYAVLYEALDQQPLTEAIDVDLEFNPDAKPVATQMKGFAGVTPGAKTTTATITNAVPRAGLEYDFWEKADKLTPVELVVFMANKKLVSKGFITNVKLKGGIGQETRLDASFHGEPLKQV